MPREIKTIAVPEERFTQLRQMQNLNGPELAELTGVAKERTKNLAEQFIELQVAFLNRDSERPLREEIKTKLHKLILPNNPELHFLCDPANRSSRFTLFISKLEADLNNPGSELCQLLKFLQLLKVKQLEHNDVIISRTGKACRLLNRYTEELSKIGDDPKADKTDLNKKQADLSIAEQELEEAKKRNPLKEFAEQDLADLLAKYRKQINKMKTEELARTLRGDLNFVVEFVQKEEKKSLRCSQGAEKNRLKLSTRRKIAAALLLLAAGATSFALYGNELRHVEYTGIPMIKNSPTSPFSSVDHPMDTVVSTKAESNFDPFKVAEKLGINLDKAYGLNMQRQARTAMALDPFSFVKFTTAIAENEKGETKTLKDKLILSIDWSKLSEFPVLAIEVFMNNKLVGSIKNGQSEVVLDLDDSSQTQFGFSMLLNWKTGDNSEISCFVNLDQGMLISKH